MQNSKIQIDIPSHMHFEIDCSNLTWRRMQLYVLIYARKNVIAVLPLWLCNATAQYAFYSA